MYLIVGLGNPGPEYARTRHNVGFLCLDAVVKQFGVEAPEWKTDHKMSAETITLEGRYLFAKPQTFMNLSGKSVSALMQTHQIKPENLTVIHDDLDLSLGTYKFSHGNGPKSHNGIASIEETIGSAFDRFRIGIDHRDPDDRLPGKAYVLQSFEEDELEMLRDVFTDVYDHLTVQMIARQKEHS